MYRHTRLLALGLVSAFFLAACEEETVPVTPQVRAIKTFTVTDVAEGQRLKFPGKVEAADTSSLSFAVAGSVVSVSVGAGDRVSKGQVLATLDKEPFEDDVNAANAELQKARAGLKEKEQDLQRKAALFSKGWVARAALEQAQSAMEAARSDVGYVTAKFNKANRSLEDTVLRAPFDGIIGERSIDPFIEVAPGQPSLILNAEGALDVAISVPEKNLARIHIGMPATVNVTPLGQEILSGRVTEIGAEGGAGNVFPVRVSLDQFPAVIRSGMTAEVFLTVARQDGPAGFLIPISAIAPGDDRSKGYVYVYQADNSTVRRMPIKPHGARDNLIAVSGVKAGDQLASAGVTFLHDGQKVKLMSWPLR